MPTTPTRTQDEAQIREHLETWTRALHAKDLDALMTLYAPDAVAFDLMVTHDHVSMPFDMHTGKVVPELQR